jgi:hypothetical protein
MDDKINRLIELRDIRDKANAEIAAIFGGETKERKAVKCSNCGTEGHTARTCTQPKSPPPNEL